MRRLAAYAQVLWRPETGLRAPALGPQSLFTVAYVTSITLDFKLVTEALKERGLLLEKIAPHLVPRSPFVAIEDTGLTLLFRYRHWHVRCSRIYRFAKGSSFAASLYKKGHQNSLPRYQRLRFYRRYSVLDARVDDARLVG